MKKLLLLTAGAFATVLSSAMIMKMYYPDGTTQRFNIDDVNKVSYEGNASSRKMVVEYASHTDTLPVVADSVVFTNDEIHTANGHEYVDLGLSYYWATNNVGASDYTLGGKFAWAEIEPSDDLEYRWKSSFDGNKLNEQSGKGFVIQHRHKYTERSIGCVFTDFDIRYTNGGLLKSLLAEDDAAFVKWGPMWSTPSADAWQELLDNCTFKYYEDYQGQSGYLVTSKVPGFEGQSVFFPVEIGMVQDNSGEYHPYEHSIYWTNTLEPSADYYGIYSYGVCFPTPDSKFFGSSLPNTMWSLFSKNMAAHVRPVIHKRMADKYGLKSAGSVQKYQVVYLNSDKSSIMEVEEVAEGKAAIGKGDFMQKIVKPQENLVFNRWSADLSSVERSLSVYPVFVVDTANTYYKVRILCPDTMIWYDQTEKENRTLLPGSPYDSVYVREGEDVPSDWLEKVRYRWAKGYNVKHDLKLTNLHANLDITFDRVVFKDYSEPKGDHRYVDLGLSVNWASGNLSDDVNVSKDSLKKCLWTDDIATKQWGDDWRLPTKEEFQELIDNCYIDRVNGVFNEDGVIDYSVGVAGYLFTSKVPGYEGRSIFLPAREMIVNCGPAPERLELSGVYLTSSKGEDGESFYLFDGEGVSILDYYDIRGWGFLRAVTAK